MADKKISQLTGASTPLAGTEVLPIVQSGSTVKVSVADLTAGRTVDATTVNATTVDATNVEVTNVKAKDGTASVSIANSTGVASLSANPILSAGTANGVLYLNGSKVATSGSALTFDESSFNVGVSGTGGLSVKFLTDSTANGRSWGVRNGYTNSGDFVILSSSTNNDTLNTQQVQIQRDGTFVWTPGGTERARVPAAGGIQVKTCVSVGDATPAASGAGITFPATQSASTDANTLDDYEEGSWTVGIAFGGASTGITYSNTTNQSKYVRIGRQVTCVGYVALTSKGSSTGTATITGLPFTVAADEPNYGGIAIGYFSNITFADFIMGRTVAGATSIALAEVTNAGVDSNITNADFANDSFMRFTLTYFI